MGERKNSKAEDLGDYVEKLYRDYLAIRDKLLSIDDETKKYMLFLAFLNNWFKSQNLGYIVVTGGFAVEILTGRAYRTYDIDLITSNQEVCKVLEGFLSRFSEKIARGYLPRFEEIASKSIEIVSTTYSRGKQPVKILVDNWYLLVDPPEDLIIAYLTAWKYWESTVDRDKAVWLYMALRDKLDIAYLRRRASEEKVADKLEELIQITSM